MTTRPSCVLMGILACACAAESDSSELLSDAGVAEDASEYRVGVRDYAAPKVAITSPATSVSLATGAIVLSGTAIDSGSGVRIVEVTLDGGTYVAATPRASGDWSNWSTSVNVATTGTHRITARATDKAGNKSWFSIT